MTRICVFGDSITFGYNDDEGGWVDRLKRFFFTQNNDVSVYNVGISGDTTENLLSRLELECIQREPNVLIFAIGINDSSYIESKENHQIDVKFFRDNLSKILEIGRKFTQTIVFIGLTRVDEIKTKPIPWDKRKYYDNENVQKYNSIIKDFCSDNNIPFVSMIDTINLDDLDDGLHPNSKGHEKIFEKIRNFLLSQSI